MPQISVIIPTYNRAQLVAEAISSVLNQTFTDFELIVVDDGSTDNTDAVIHSFTDPRLKFLKRSNGGVSAARNAGLSACMGEFVAFLDSDDLWLPERLGRQVARLDRNHEVGLVYGQYFSTTLGEGPSRLGGACYPQLGLRQLLVGPAFHWSTVLISRAWLEQVGGFDEQFPVGEEWELTLRLALGGCVMVCVAEPLAIVRQQPNSLAKTSHRHEDALMAVLDKTFSDSRMPRHSIGLRDMARASQLLRMAASAFVASQLDMGREFLQRALATCPSLASEHIELVVDTLVYRIRGLSLEDPEKTLQRVTTHLPGGNNSAGELKRRLWGRFYEISAFHSYQLGQRGRCIGYVIRAIGKRPACLRNRGLVSILARSLVGNQSFDEFKRLAGLHRGAPVNE